MSIWYLVVVGARAQEPTAGPSPVTAIELGWMERELAPVVEEVAGRSFVRLPEVVLADPEQISEVVYKEQVHLLQESGQVQSQDIDDNARRTATHSGTFAGKYGFLDGKLYISVQGVEDSLTLEGAPDWMLRPALRIVIA